MQKQKQKQKDTQREAWLWQTYWQVSSVENRNRLVEFYYRDSIIVAKYCYRLYGSDLVDLDDFIQEAQIALTESVERYKSQMGAEFITFANFRIRGRILNSLKYTSEKASYYDYQKRSKKQRRDSIISDLVEAPLSYQSIGELIIRLAYTELLDSMAENDRESFTEQPISDDDESLNTLSHAINPYQTCVLDDLKTQLKSRVKLLPGIERQIIELHYYGNLGFEEIGSLVGLSKTRVSQLHKQSILTLRARNFEEIAV